MILLLTLTLVGLSANNALPIESDDIESWKKSFENSELFVSDMLINHNIKLGNAISDEDYRWPGYPGGAKIPYVIDQSVANEKKLIESAMEQYHENTCVRFVPRTDEKEYIKIFKGLGCYAVVGRNSSFPQPQPLSLGRGCNILGLIIHELGHVLGLYHEQNRSDRDDYVIIYLENVQRGQAHNFFKLKPEQNILYTDFDYESIMIYGNYAFSKRPNVLKTMEAKNGQKLTEPYEKSQMSASDILRVNKMYKCPGYES